MLASLLNIDQESLITHINELLQILVQIGQIVFPLLVVRNKSLLLLQQALPLLFQRQSFRMLVINTSNRQSIIICIGMLWMFGEELLDGDER